MKYDEREEKEIERREKLRNQLWREIYKSYDLVVNLSTLAVFIVSYIILFLLIKYAFPWSPKGTYFYATPHNRSIISNMFSIPCAFWIARFAYYLFDHRLFIHPIYHKKYEKAVAKLYPPTKYEIEKKREEDRKREEEFKRDQEKRKGEWEEERRRKAENRQREKEYAKEYHEQHKSDPATINRCQNLLKLLECFDDNYYMSVDPTIRMCWREIKFNMVRERNFANMYCDELEEHLLNNYVDTLITKPMGYEWVMTHKRQF